MSILHDITILIVLGIICNFIENCISSVDESDYTPL